MSDQEPFEPTQLQAVPASDSATLNYAFLVHSQRSLTQNLPPRIDNKLLARQKRRRTSPEDYAILEGEYQLNPKPGKAARASIVSRVSLGEKEVQIWFQNRRQNDRRKSKPFQPKELVVFKSALGDNTTAEPASSDDGRESGNQKGAAPHTAGHINVGGTQLSFPFDAVAPVGSAEQGHCASSQENATAGFLGSSQPAYEVEPIRREVQDRGLVNPVSHLFLNKRKRAFSDVRSDRSKMQPVVCEDKSQEPSSPPSLRLSLSLDGEALVRDAGELTPSPLKGRNTLRIAMSSDGKAVVRTENELSPSRSRISMSSMRNFRSSRLRRSSSGVVPEGHRSLTAVKDRPFGRSRDLRNWESFFDADARSSLGPTSSQGFLNADSSRLFRSLSQRSLHRSLSARQSSLAEHPEWLSSPASRRVGEKKRKLSRAVSSLGRLETERKIPTSNPHVLSPKGAKVLLNGKGKDGDLGLGDGDSDKENWIPGTRTSRVHRRAAHNGQRSVVRDISNHDVGANKGIGAVTSGKRFQTHQGALHKSRGGSGADISAFLASGPGSSQEEDLDCIQGLLSLSQGEWR